MTRNEKYPDLPGQTAAFFPLKYGPFQFYCPLVESGRRRIPTLYLFSFYARMMRKNVSAIAAIKLSSDCKSHFPRAILRTLIKIKLESWQLLFLFSVLIIAQILPLSSRDMWLKIRVNFKIKVINLKVICTYFLLEKCFTFCSLTVFSQTLGVPITFTSHFVSPSFLVL